MNTRNPKSKWSRFGAIALIFATLLFYVNPVVAAEKKIVVVEKSDKAEDKTNHTDNGTNLPAGSTAVEASSNVDAAAKILAQLGAGDCIKELHFRGHGSPGNQSVGDGVNHDDAKRINGTGDWKEAYKGLKGKFCSGAIIHLWGCRSGSCTLGADKLKEIADFFGVTARAPVNVVNAGGQTTYAGPVQEATPNNPAPACIMPTEEKAAPAVPKKDADEMVNTGVPLNAVVANPNMFTLNLNNSNLVSYNELNHFPSCPPANASSINFAAIMTFSTNPDPNVISFFIQNYSQTTTSYNFCGSPTGTNQYSLAGNYLAQGTINKMSGDVIGSMTYVQSNSLGYMPMTFDIRGNWAPGSPNLHMLFFGAPTAAATAFIPTLPEWGLILLGLLLLTAGTFYLKRRFSF